MQLRRFPRYGLSGLSTVSLGVVLAACAQIAGISQYETKDAVPDAQAPAPGADATVMVEAGDDGAAPLPDSATPVPESSVPMAYACSRGGCNTATRSCVAAGHCYCATDNDCTHGKCVGVSGQNDVSCGTNCTGAGPTDGFNCTSSCTSGAFGYAPSNFDPASLTPPAADTTDCDATYDSSAHMFTAGACAGQAPVIAPGVAQSGGHAVDILVFKNLTIAGTLTLVGGNPVILAVYGSATLRGTIDASASGSTPGAGGNDCPSASNGSVGPSGLWEPGASGGGQSAGGGAGGASKGGMGSPASSAQTTAAAPLTGGCAGSAPYTGTGLGFSPSVGAGGGGVQISAAGSLDLSAGTIKASGSNGGDGEVGKCGVANYPSQNGTGGAGGGSGGTILVEGSPVTDGTYQASGGSGGHGGATPSPANQAGGAGGMGGAAGAPGVNGSAGNSIATPPSGCTGGNGNWSGGGGGGGAGGVVKTNQGMACTCGKDADCTSGHCSNVSNQCTGTCTGDTTAGAYDSMDCQVVNTTSRPL